MTKIKVWCLVRDQYSHIKPVEDQFEGDADFIYDLEWNPDVIIASQPDIVICINDFYFDVARCIEIARQHGIPSLVLQDGILEWRCQYENPIFGMGGGAPQHQPVIADKIACLGWQSAKQIGAWGNQAKVEVTGMPKLDAIRSISSALPHVPGKHILVMTAKKPGFTQEQIDITVRSLKDLKRFFESRPDIIVSWRITKGLDKLLGVDNQLDELSTQNLADALQRVDAVITTPSTAMLEAMLMSRPVACLDYHNTPHFVQTAWNISSSEHIHSVVESILSPSSSKMAFQTDCLNAALYTTSNSSASERVVNLITKMVEFAQSSQSLPISFPPNLLGYDFLSNTHISTPSLSSLYPAHPAFIEDDCLALRLNYARLLKDYEKKSEIIRKQTLSHLISQGIIKMYHKLHTIYANRRR